MLPPASPAAGTTPESRFNPHPTRKPDATVHFLSKKETDKVSITGVRRGGKCFERGAPANLSVNGASLTVRGTQSAEKLGGFGTGTLVTGGEDDANLKEFGAVDSLVEGTQS